MKRITLLSIIGLLVISFAGCGGKKMGRAIKGPYIVSESWIDDNTFQVIAWGEANLDVVGEARWRNQAKEGAQMMAEKRIIEKFKGYVLEASGYTEEGGEIVRVTFDDENRACEIVYRVHGRNLKRRVENGFQVKEIERKTEE